MMSTNDIDVMAMDRDGAGRTPGWSPAGGVVGALLASSCCIAPLLLLTLGVSGAWIGNLTALEPYKPLFLGVALVFSWHGFNQVYFKSKPACEDGSYCASLWVATALVVLAVSVGWWAPLFY